MKQIASLYTYNKTTGVITLTGVNIDRDQLLLIVNTTRNVTYYNFADSTTTLQTFTKGANTSVTLASSVVSASSAHNNADALTIYYDDQLSSAAFNTSETFGTGVIQTIADAEKDTIRSSLWIPDSSNPNGTAGEGQLLSHGHPMPSVLKYLDDEVVVQPLSDIEGYIKVKGYGTAIIDDVPANRQIKVSADGVVQVNQADLGAKADAVATTDTGTFSVIALIKRGLQNWTSLLAKIPALVSGRIPVDGSGVTQPVSGTAIPSLPSFYSGDPYPAGTKIIPVGGWTDEADGAHWQALTLTDSGHLYTYTLLAPSTNLIGSVLLARGTSPANTTFTSTTPNTQIAGATTLRRVFTVFNEGAGVLYISSGGACTTTNYQVRLSAGDYWECPEGQLSLLHSAVFATAGTARVSQVT